jgi:hypothetical protein
MDIAALSIMKSQAALSQNVGIALFKKNMDSATNNSQSLIKMMELSVNPSLGSKLDTKV